MEQKYIIRCDRAGVFYGEIESRVGQEVVLKNVRRLWEWYGALTVSDLAVTGTKQPKLCKFTVAVERMTVLDAIELIPCTDAAVKSIDSVPIWKL